MCSPTTCRSCGKTTWTGCGNHIEEALAGVPAKDRCACEANLAPTQASASIFSRVLGR